MKAIPTAIPDVLLIAPDVMSDERGCFFESFNHRSFADLVGREVEFVQDNHTCSRRQVLRGLHYQIRHAQGKLVRVVSGTVFDVVVDLRKHSATFGRYVGAILSAENKSMIWIPEGFAHGFLVLSDTAECLYKTTDYWYPEHERCIRWDDPALAIEWPLQGKPVLSARDAGGQPFREAEVFP